MSLNARSGLAEVRLSASAHLECVTVMEQDWRIEMGLSEIYDQRGSGCQMMAADRRRSRREEVRLPGKIIVGDTGRQIDCTIVDISATGARLAISPKHCTAPGGRNVLPSTISLFLDRECTNVGCIKVWCTANEVGVQFCTPFRSW